MIDAEIAGSALGPEVGQQSIDRPTGGAEPVDRGIHRRVVGGHDGERIATLPQAQDAFGDALGRQIVHVLDQRCMPAALRVASRPAELRSEVPVEFRTASLQEKAEPSLRTRYLCTLRQQARRMEADLLGRRADALGRFGSNRRPLVEDAIHRRDADAGLPGDVGEGRAPSRFRFDRPYHCSGPSPDGDDGNHHAPD